MSLRLRDDIHWCNCNGRAVFLDVVADRYFCLPPTANDAFLRLSANPQDPRAAEALKSLFVAGVLIDGCKQDRITPPPNIVRPTRDFPVAQFKLLLARYALDLCYLELSSTWRLRRKGLHTVLRALHGLDHRVGELGEQSRAFAGEVVAASTALALILRSHDRCLARALAVHQRCRREGISTLLIFGVIAHPFAAHCWVQLGSEVLVGGFEQARLYTPIFVVP